jgi:fumagillin biosynthesis dioxygenase
MDVESKKRALLETGCCVVPGVLTRAEADHVRDRLWRAAEESERRGVPTRQIGLDPNEHNVRVFYLLERDAIFRELILHPTALDFVGALLTDDFLISNSPPTSRCRAAGRWSCIPTRASSCPSRGCSRGASTSSGA